MQNFDFLSEIGFLLKLLVLIWKLIFVFKKREQLSLLNIKKKIKD